MIIEMLHIWLHIRGKGCIYQNETMDVQVPRWDVPTRVLFMFLKRR